MKLRIKGNSIRLRLTRSEVEAFVSAGSVAERLDFPQGNSLTYRILSDSQLEQPASTFADDVLTVRVPEAQLRHWSAPSEVSMRGSQELPDGQTLGLLIEKDFACLVEREGEDDSDAFAHPEAGRTHGHPEPKP